MEDRKKQQAELEQIEAKLEDKESLSRPEFGVLIAAQDLENKKLDHISARIETLDQMSRYVTDGDEVEKFLQLDVIQIRLVEEAIAKNE